MTRVSRAVIEEKLRLPQYRALLDVISDQRYEGANYNTLFGGGTFDSYASHPNRTVCSGGYCSSAAGRYQFLDFVWREVATNLGLGDFSPRSQDIAAIYRMLTIRRVSFEDIESGDPTRWMGKIHDEWTSIPGSSAGLERQDKGTPAEFISRYQEYLAFHEGRGPAPRGRKSSSYDGVAALPGEAGYNPPQLQAALENGINTIINSLFDRYSFIKWPFTQQEAITHTGTKAQKTAVPLTTNQSYGPSTPNFAFNQPSNNPDLLGTPGVNSSSGAGILPTKGTFTSGFGMRKHPKRGTWSPHNGIDIGAATGTPIVSVQGGQVSFAGWNGGFGNLVIVTHPSGFQSYYAHMSRIAVRLNQVVRQGELLGEVGSTGMSTGPHLHFEWRQPNNAPIDPRTSILRGLI